MPSPGSASPRSSSAPRSPVSAARPAKVLAIAVPAPVTSVAAEPVAESTAVRARRLAAEQARASSSAATRAARRAQLVAAKQAAKRAATLAKQGKSIEAQQAKIKAEKAAAAAARAAAEAKAKAEAAAAKLAQERALANRGYEPGTTDPNEIARQILKNKYGYGAEPVHLLQQHHHAREHVGDERHEPELGRVRDPAGPARLEDGLGRQRLADQPGHPDHLGHRVHEGPLRQPVRRLGLQARPRLVLSQIFSARAPERARSGTDLLSLLPAVVGTAASSATYP